MCRKEALAPFTCWSFIAVRLPERTRIQYVTIGATTLFAFLNSVCAEICAVNAD